MSFDPTSYMKHNDYCGWVMAGYGDNASGEVVAECTCGRDAAEHQLALLLTEALGLAKLVLKLDSALEDAKGIKTSKPSDNWLAAQRFIEEYGQ